MLCVQIKFNIRIIFFRRQMQDTDKNQIQLFIIIVPRTVYYSVYLILYSYKVHRLPSGLSYRCLGIKNPLVTRYFLFRYGSRVKSLTYNKA